MEALFLISAQVFGGIGEFGAGAGKLLFFALVVLLCEIPFGFPLWRVISRNFSQPLTKDRESEWALDHSDGDEQRCLEVVRRQFVGEGEEAHLLCDR